MYANDSEDKNHLAMLAIPVILSMLLSFSGDIREVEKTVEESVPTVRVERENREANGPIGSEIPTTENDTKDNVRKKELLVTVDKGDYDHFLTLTKDTPFAEIMTESAFYELREQYTHSRDGFVASPYTRHTG